MGEARNIQHLADQPAGEDQVTRARELCGASGALNARLDGFLKTGPTRGQFIDFLEQLKSATQQEKLDANIAHICALVGIENPTGTEKLLAIQIGLLQEQNANIGLLANRAGQAVELEKKLLDKPATSGFTSLLAGFLIGGMMSR
ncbi:hypothetical protein ACXIVK_27910 [Paraburkholderia caledonica]|jgi:hypothetical protein